MNERNFFKAVFLANLSILGIIVVGMLLWTTRRLVTPTLAALLVAYLLFPILNRCAKIGLPRWLGVTTVIVLLGLSVSFTVSVVIPIITLEINRFRAESTTHEPLSANSDKTNPSDDGRTTKTAPPDDEKKGTVLPKPDSPVTVWPAPSAVEEQLNQKGERPPPPETVYSESALLNFIQQISIELKERGLIQEAWRPDQIRIAMNNWIASRGQELIAIVSNKAIQLGNFLIIFTFVLIFSLIEGDRFYKALISFLPNSMFEGGVYIINSTTKMFGAYIRGVAIETIILAVICFAFLLPFLFIFQKLTLVLVLFVTLIISVTNVIRIVGPIFGALAGAIIAFSSTSDVKAAIVILIAAGVVQVFDNALVLPLVMEGQMDIHPVLCMLGVLAGGIVGGVLGMILAIPIIGGTKVLIRVLSVELHKFTNGSKQYYIYQTSPKV